jgi:hypothetical protein
VIDEVEVRLHRTAHTFVVVGGGLHRGAHPGDKGVAVRVEQGEVQLQLARKVLIQHWFGDAGALGDVIHRGSVITLCDEHLLRGGQQLLPPS